MRCSSSWRYYFDCFPVRKRLQDCSLQVSAVAVFLLLFPVTLKAQSNVGVRLEVTSVGFIDDIKKEEAPDKEPVKEEKTKGGEVGTSKKVRVNFRITDKLRNMKPPYKVSGDEGRVGLFLRRERGTHASVQRGTLEKCETGYCSAIFNDNALFRFYGESMANPGEWFVQSLQNPAIDERWLELAKREEPPAWDYLWRIEARYSRMGLYLKETSSTPFNASKQSRRRSYGNRFELQVGMDDLDLFFRQWGVALSTTGFFSDSFSTDYKGVSYGMAYGQVLGKYFVVGGQLARDDLKFITSNDDEAILNTRYIGFPLGVYMKYLLPWDVFSLFGGGFVFEVGEGKVSADYTLFGGAEDTDEWKRGSSGSWKKIQFDWEHFFTTRSTSLWFHDWKIGVMFGFAKANESFSGDAEGPSSGLPSGTKTSGNYVTWGFTLGRQHTW